MKYWFVSRHPGAIEWAQQEGLMPLEQECEVAPTIDPKQDVREGDIVMGTLPVHLAAQVCARGARYLHLAMEIPDQWRDRELTPLQMRSFGARLQEFVIVGQEPLRTVPARQDGGSIHVCIVSDQQFANLLPILKRRPDRIELVCSPEMIAPGRGLDTLAHSLARFGYGGASVTPHKLGDECSSEMYASREQARALRNHLLEKYPDHKITLNATGGTKAISSGFVREFQGFETIYTDTARANSIRFMADFPQEPEPMGVLIDNIDDYFHCQGYEVVRCSSRDPEWCLQAKERLIVTKFLAENSTHYLLGSFNRAIYGIEQEKLNKSASKGLSQEERDAALAKVLPDCPIRGLKSGWFVNPLVEAGLLRANDGGQFVFASLGASKYLTGGWIEELAWLLAIECGAQVVETNVVLRTTDRGGDSKATGAVVENELDLVVLHNNRLLIGECKTINWRGLSAKQEIFNKLDALGTHARGLMGKSVLISAQELDGIASERARAYDIQVIDGQDLLDLDQMLKKLIGV